MNHTLWGLDFGTTTTYLSESVGESSVTYSLRTGAGKNVYLPSVVRKTADGLLVGEPAEAGAEEEIIRSVKRAITLGKAVMPIIAEEHESRVSVSADEAIVAILAQVRAISRRDVGDVPIRLGCPAMWDSDQRQRLLDLSKKAGFKIQFDTLIDEPVAACMGWYQSQINRGLLPSGITLVFDMGGGTLDVAALSINSDLKFPQFSVLGSEGIDSAGDALDSEIANLLLAKEEPASERQGTLLANPGRLKRAARQLKVEIGDRDNAEVKMLLSDGSELLLELTAEELREAFHGQFERSFRLVLEVLRVARTSIWRNQGWKASELVAIPQSELLGGVSNFILVGGMAHMPLLRQMLVEHGVPASKIFGPESLDSDAAVSLGLGLDTNFEHLSLDRPGFNFELHWTYKGEQRIEVVYEAYSKFYQPQDAWTKPLMRTWRNSDLTEDKSDTGTAVFCARTPSGEYLEFLFEGESMNGLGPLFRFGDNKNQIITIQPSGRIFIRDGQGKTTTLKIEKWPVLKDRRGKLKMTRSQETGDFTSGLSWHERPYD